MYVQRIVVAASRDYTGRAPKELVGFEFRMLAEEP